MHKKIAIIGATGLLGKPVANQLTLSGFDVTALVRKPEQAKSQLPSIQLLQGDLRNAHDLDRLLEGKDAVHLNLSVRQNEKPSDWHTESDGLKLLIASAKRNNIQRISYLSSLIMNYQGTAKFNWWVYDIKLEAVRLIKESGIPYTIFYPSTFMETLVHQYKMGMFMLLAGESKYKQHFIASEDYAKQAVRSFQILKEESKDYLVQGLESFNSDEAVAEFVKYYPKGKLITMKAPLGLIKFYGLFLRKLNYGYHILESINNYPEKFEAEETWNELGKPGITLQHFIKNL